MRHATGSTYLARILRTERQYIGKDDTVGSQEPNNSPHVWSGLEGDGEEIMVDAPFVR